jgi:hypothetical protein
MIPAAMPVSRVEENEPMKLVQAILVTAALLVAGAASASAMYGVDEDRDGRTDRMLILEQSDSLA